MTYPRFTFILISLLICGCTPKDETTLMVSSGCFWKVQGFFDENKNVISSTCGYTGGKSQNPTYENAKKNGHVEAVRIQIKEADYESVLKHFFENFPAKRIKAKNEMHGKMFRARIYYFDDKQKKLLAKLSAQYDDEETITVILAAQEFYTAEDDHQDWYKKRCKIN
ncbi:bifunctional methionine sulfoxide reductase B/A protein [Lentisphaera araneosa HTCC2155]|uniref:peptide-methionine (S)-S-oxide reductase n=1 Tax=Lentisphaera araneosa HTCC2155 TaxID=313628 RepID=A6DHT0_9BACT|nr:peptide-methionine (S)-S-oxide reductase [Lentisphaera araneosa]EDM28584.1 bifunctional methionine sulfoxide reductase B/A protein [Lentisphaera araneosa HTCC2155]